MAGLHFPITADNGNFMRALHEVTAGVRNASLQIEADGGNIDRTISRIKNGLMSLGAGIGFKEITGAVANTRGEFQQLEVAFKTMLGSEEEAAKLMSQLVRTAAITPFDLKGVADGAKQLLAYGTSAEDVNETLVRLGDIAAGLSIPLGDLVYLYGTTMAQGRLYTQDLNQFTGRGIPMIGELAKQFGVAESKVKELVEAGKVGFPEVQKVIESLTNQGGKFGGLMEEQSKTISGQISNIEDAFDTTLNEIGKSQQGLISGTLDVTSTLVENWQTVLAVLGDIAVAYGVDKAILAGSSAVTSSSYAFELKELTALLPVKEANINLDVKEALAKGKITEATAAKVIAMRAEVKGYMDSLAASKAAAVAEAQLAAQKYRMALQQSIASKAAVTAKREELIASGEICGAYISENAIKEMGIVTEKAKAASIQSTIAKQEYHAAVTKKNIATEALDTATTNANTAAQTLNARSTNILTVAKAGLVKTTRKLYATMMAHPYALIAAAVAALGYGIYKLVTYQTEAEKIADAHKRTTQNLELELEKENERLEDLNNTLKTSKKGSKDWKEAKDELVSQYGKYLNGIGSEIEKVGYLSDSYKKLTEAVQQSVAARQIAKFQEDNAPNHDELIKSITEKLSGEVILSDPDKNGRIVGNNFRKVKIDKKTQKQWIKALIRNLYQGDDSGMTSMLKDFLRNNKSGVFSMDSFGTEVFNARKTQDEYDKDLKDLKDIYGYKDSSSTADSNKSETKDKEYWENKKKDAESRLEALDSIAAKGKEGAKIKKEIKQYEKEIEEAYSTKTKKTSGPTAGQIESKQTEAHQKIIDLMKQQAEERLKLQQDYEYQQWQNRIDLMEEGEGKVIAQMRLDNVKERMELEEQKREAIQAEISRQKAVFDARQDELAAGNKKYAKQVFDPTSIYDPGNNAIDPEIQKIIDRFDSLNADLLAKQQKSESDRLQSAKESFNAYLREFGSYQQRREAIQADYDSRIGKAANDGERMTLEAQKHKELSDLDYQQWIDSGEISLAFGEIANFSQQTISRLIKDMEKYREKVVATFDPEKIAKYNEALDNLRLAEAENAFSAFGGMVPEYFTRRLAIQKQINDEAKIGIELANKRNELEARTVAQKGAVKIQAKAAGYNISDEDLADPKKVQQIAANLTKAAGGGQNLASALHDALVELMKLNGESAELENASRQWDGNFSTLKETLANLDGEEKFDAICESVSSASGLVGDLAGQVAGMADAMGEEGLGAALGTVGEVMGSVQNVASGFAQGGMIGGIAAAAGELLKWTTKFIMSGDEKHEKNIVKLQERIDTLQVSYDNLGESVDDAFSTDASGIIEQQNTILMQQKALIQQQMAEEKAKKKSDDEKLKEYQERLDAIDKALGENEKKAKEAIIGQDVKSAIEDFATRYAEAWDDGTDAAKKSMAAVKSIVSSALNELIKKQIQPTAQKFYDTLAKAMEDGILTNSELAALDAIKATMDEIAAREEEQYKKIQERYKDLDELREELTDISFDSVRDNFKSLLLDMESTTEDFTENWTDMIRNSLIEGLMDNKYDKMLKEWYDEFAEAMDDQTLTDEERERLRQQYNEIIQQGIADRNAINDLVGGGAYSQQASSGSSWNMNQETGDELNGRFTAMVELEATNNVLVSDGNAISREILATLRSMTLLSMSVSGSGDNSTLLDIKDMMFLSTSYLEDIAKYSKLLAAISSDVAEMKNKVKDL